MEGRLKQSGGFLGDDLEILAFGKVQIPGVTEFADLAKTNLGKVGGQNTIHFFSVRFPGRDRRGKIKSKAEQIIPAENRDLLAKFHM